MAASIEERAATLLEACFAERGTTPARVAAELGLEPAAVERLLGGREPLELARLERVLAALGASPAEFFARLYGGGDSPAAPAPAAPAGPPTAREQPISRREIEEVIASLRSMIDGMVRMLDAEREAANPRSEG